MWDTRLRYGLLLKRSTKKVRKHPSDLIGLANDLVADRCDGDYIANTNNNWFLIAESGNWSVELDLWCRVSMKQPKHIGYAGQVHCATSSLTIGVPLTLETTSAV